MGEKDFHLLAILLHIADVVEEDTSVAIQFRQLLRQAQVTLSSEQALHQCRGGRPQDRVPLLGQFIGHGTEGMTFANAWLANGDDIGRLLEKRSAFETFQLQT
jgi:hypothetical protein